MNNSNDIVKTSTITVKVGLNADKMPVHLEWDADDRQSSNGNEDLKAVLLSFFDRSHRDTLRIDLWTNDLQVQEMDRLMYHTLRGMANTYYQATQNGKLASHFELFAKFFGEETGIVPKTES